MGGQMANDVEGMSKGRILHPILLLLISGFASLLLITPASATVIEIGSKTVSVDQRIVTINIMCFPSEPIKGWELVVSFDQTILSLVAIADGDFFDGYETYFVSNGSIAYALVLGDGNVTGNGSLCMLTFDMVNEGTTNLGLFDAGVCNETRYLPLIVMNGSVTVTGSRLPIVLQRGWNNFKNSVYRHEGWNSFENDVVLTQGWTSFRTVRMPSTDPWMMFVGAVISLAFAGFVIVLFIKGKMRA
jgi:hypothetical protein